MTIQVEEETMTAVAPEAPELRVADRCDSCGSQAFVIVGKGDLMLWLCAHHTHQHFDALTLDGWLIVADQRSSINQKPGSSA